MSEREIGKLIQGFEDISGGIDDIKAIQQKLLEQTTKTNGRVSRLEFWKTAIISVSGFLWGTTFIFAPHIIEYVATRITERVEQKLDAKISQAVEDALENIELTEVK